MGRRGIVRSVALVALVGLTGAGIAACGSTSRTALSGADLAKVIHRAADRSSAAASMSAEMTAKLDGETLLKLGFSGRNDGSMLQGDVSTTGGPDITYVVVDGSYYYGYPHLPPGKKWVQLSEADLLTLGVDIAAARQQSGGAALAYLSGAGDDVTRIGDATIRGLHTVHYRFQVDLADLARKQKVLSEQLVDQVSGLLGKRAPMDVWIDDDGFAVRLVYGADLSKAPDPPKGMPAEGKLSYQFDMSSYDGVSTVTAPPPESVESFAQYKAAASGTDTH